MAFRVKGTPAVEHFRAWLLLSAEERAEFNALHAAYITAKEVEQSLEPKAPRTRKPNGAPEPAAPAAEAGQA